ncbi:MAG: protein translocase subunit SecD [Actinobacteria bacterium]|nr:protein translocase subunit SecD [Actinomycetota bacterium]MCL6105536.1 protein translocase subunit SecD [Actinomycetota bacterium]
MKKGPLIISTAIVIAVSFGFLLSAVLANWSPLLGLDLQGGLSVVYRPSHKVTSSTLTEVINIMNNRVNGLGISQPNITTQSGDVLVQLPGIKDPQKALSVIGETAQMLFRPVLCLAPPYTPPVAKKNTTTTTIPPTAPLPSCGTYTETSSNTINNTAGIDPAFATYPSTPRSADVASKTVLLPASSSSGVTGLRYVLGPAPLTGKAITTASAAINPTTGQWFVNFNLTGSGTGQWNSLAQQNFHKEVAMDLDAQVVSAPIIDKTNSTFTPFNGSGQITGTFTSAQAKSLALALRYGALPVRLVKLTVQTVSATLGKSSLRAGLAAGLLGLLLVMLYVVLYYRALGLVVVFGLVTTAALLWGVISTLSHTYGLTLDLSGVTGIIVSIGITVDSYIVYFERLKDEVRAGRSIRSSVDKGFTRAFRTIVAADLVSLIGAILLYFLAIGAVKGFAFFLGLATVIDVFTAYFFTRPIVILVGRTELFTNARWLGVARGLAAERA